MEKLPERFLHSNDVVAVKWKDDRTALGMISHDLGLVIRTCQSRLGKDGLVSGGHWTVHQF